MPRALPAEGPVAARPIDVRLPPGYPDAAPHAVAVTFHGQMLFDADTVCISTRATRHSRRLYPPLQAEVGRVAVPKGRAARLDGVLIFLLTPRGD
jgi:hypothetical protein